MFSFEFANLIFSILIPNLFLIPFFILILISGVKQEEYIRLKIFLLLYPIINLAMIVVTIILGFFFISFTAILGIIILTVTFIISLIALIFFLVFSISNREEFGIFLMLSAIFLLVDLTIGYIANLMNIILISFLGFAASYAAMITSLIGLIGTIMEATALVMLVIHGFKNDDTYMIVAGFVRMVLIAYYFLRPFLMIL
ncbi:MAG: hypothetical protein GF317_10215 [Candidatus Lokiarchaeota archaeon]|nr:hypothetical protein [Candidatus Lokiarchaeota archaeon]MBD3200034.1 hypothetical protein [Candidatus Lokiarchaeota archaeon]